MLQPARFFVYQSLQVTRDHVSQSKVSIVKIGFTVFSFCTFCSFSSFFRFVGLLKHLAQLTGVLILLIIDEVIPFIIVIYAIIRYLLNIRDFTENPCWLAMILAGRIHPAASHSASLPIFRSCAVSEVSVVEVLHAAAMV